MSNRGLTLPEVAVGMAIIGTITVALGFSYSSWLGKYKVEKAIMELYSDLMHARDYAMTRNSEHFMDFNYPGPAAGYGTYRIAEDTDGDSEGDDDKDGVIDAAGHTFLPPFRKTVEHTITNNFAEKIINFDRRGIVQIRGQNYGGTICLFTDKDPDYDCIVVFTTRISVGKLKKQLSEGGTCKAENCVKK